MLVGFFVCLLSLFPIQMVLESWIHNLAGIWPCIILSYWVFLGQKCDLKLIVFSILLVLLWPCEISLREEFLINHLHLNEQVSQHISPPKSFVLWSLRSVEIKWWRQSLSKFMSILFGAGIFLNETKITSWKQLPSLPTSLGYCL